MALSSAVSLSSNVILLPFTIYISGQMKIAAILHTHGSPDVTVDTLNSIRTNMTSQVLLLVDGCGWEMYEKLDIPVYKLTGFNHGLPRNPYRNIALGMLSAGQNWVNDVDWFCYMEYDGLVASPAFKTDLAELEKQGVWLAGNDYRTQRKVNLRFLETIVQEKFGEIVYMLGACLFYHRDFVRLLLEKEILERLLYYTNDFPPAFFPYFSEWDLTEHAMPTMVKHFGGKIHQFAVYNKDLKLWAGDHRKYPIRFRPELNLEEDYFLQASILHPLKDFNNPIRVFHREKRLRQHEAQ
jgi:hypothetical protein